MELSVIIPTKDRGVLFDRTLACLLEAIRDIDAEVIVVNDSLTTRPNVPADDPRVRLVTNRGSGVVAARNHGASEARAPLLLFLDDDVLVSQRSMRQLLDLHRDLPNACTNVNWEYTQETNQELEKTQFGRFLKAHGMTSHEGWYNHPSWKRGELFRSKAVASFHLCIAKADFIRAGGYNEEMPYATFGDIDFPLRLSNAGIQCYVHAGITVYHNEIDKLDLPIWLWHWEHRSSYLRMAADSGLYHLKQRSTPGRDLVLRLMAHTMPLWLLLLRWRPNRKAFDPLHFRLLSAIQAAHIFKGYNYSGAKESNA